MILIALGNSEISRGALEGQPGRNGIQKPNSEVQLGLRNNNLKMAMEQTMMALGLPPKNRIAALRAQGPQGYRNLRAIMLDTKSRSDSRWLATTALGRVGGKLSLPDLERAMRDDSWELRSAALISMRRIDERAASHWAKKLLQDKAMVVRVTAVETIGLMKDRSALPNLWRQLGNRINFRGNRGLFIRRRIVETLGDLESSASTDRFLSLLNEDDTQINYAAISALEKLTGQTLGNKADTIKQRRDRWIEWASRRG